MARGEKPGAPGGFFDQILDIMAFISHYYSMDYAISTGGLASRETPFPAQVQPGWFRKEGAAQPLPSQGADRQNENRVYVL